MKYFYRLSENFNLKIRYKNESYLMKLLSFILFFNNFKYYTTTIGSTVYFPSKEYVKNHIVESMVILCHEHVHVYDEKISGKILYTIKYLFPQILTLLFIPLVFVNLWFLVGFFLILPLPAYFRKNIEVRGYIGSLMGQYEALKLMKLSEGEIRYRLYKSCDNINKQFYGPAYYFMWPFGVDMKKYVNDILNDEDMDVIFLSTAAIARQLLFEYKKTK